MPEISSKKCDPSHTFSILIVYFIWSDDFEAMVFGKKWSGVYNDPVNLLSSDLCLEKICRAEQIVLFVEQSRSVVAAVIIADDIVERVG